MLGRRSFLATVAGVVGVGMMPSGGEAQVLEPIWMVKGATRDTICIDWFRFTQLPSGKWVSEMSWRRNGGPWREWRAESDEPVIELPDVTIGLSEEGKAFNCVVDDYSVGQMRVGQSEWSL